MSENTPDTILGNSAIDADDNEPSMEDILASIRQIIAEDKVEDSLALTDDEAVLNAKPESPVETLVQEDNGDVNLATQLDTQSELIREVPMTRSVEAGEPQQSEDVEEGILDLISFVDENTNDEQEIETKDVSGGLEESLELNVEPVDTTVVTAPIVNEDDVKSLADNVTDEVNGAFDDEFADLTTLVEVAPEKPVDISVVLDSELTAILPDVEVTDDLGDDDTLIIPKISDDTPDMEPLADMLKPSENSQSNSDDVKDMSIFFEDLDEDNNQELDAVAETPKTTENIGALVEKPFEETHVENDIDEQHRKETLPATPDADIKLVKSLLADLMDDPEIENDEDISPMKEESIDEEFGKKDSGQKDSGQKESGAGFLAADEIGDLGAGFFDDAVVITDNAVEPSVKSDPIIEENNATEKSMLDEMLETVIKDEVAVHKEMSALLPQGDVAAESIEMPIAVSAQASEVDEVSTPDEGVFTDISANKNGDVFFEELVGNEEDTKTLLDVVTESKSVTMSESDIENDDDIVVLPNVDLTSKMALMAKTGAALAVAGVAVTVVKTAMKAELPELPEPVEQQNEHVVAPFVAKEQVQEEIEQDTTSINAENELKEQENMAQSAKTESILDAGEHRAGVDAFASLSAAVKEKEIEETRGPAIGDLVQDALKPMLKEWLDANLKKIVEKAVTAEVKRISSGK